MVNRFERVVKLAASELRNFKFANFLVAQPSKSRQVRATWYSSRGVCSVLLDGRAIAQLKLVRVDLVGNDGCGPTHNKLYWQVYS